METYTQHRLEGRSACIGVATGRPIIIRNQSDLDHVAIGDILVAIETDISYVPAMLRAAAIVTETGGRFCHAAIWAREHRKPTVLQAANATSMLSQVPSVLVDANTGYVEWDTRHE